MLRIRQSLPLLGLIACLSAFAQTSAPEKSPMFEDFKGDGFYWYKKEPEKKVQKKEEPKPEVEAKEKSPSDAKPEALSTAWFIKNMPILRDKAIDDPTTENVKNFMYAQRVVLDRSQNFSQKVKEVVATDPFLDENNRVPSAQYAQVVQMNQIEKSKDEVLAHLAGKAGLWVFVDTPDKCSACEQYVSSVLVGAHGIPGLVKKHNFNYKKIYVNTPEGQAAAQSLNLKVTPTTVLVVPPAGYYLISQGLMAESQLYERILVASKAYGLIPDELIAKANPYGKDVLTAKQMNGFSSEADPSEVIKSLRNRIHGSPQ